MPTITCAKTGISFESDRRLRNHPSVQEYLKKAGTAAKPALESLCEQCKTEGWTLETLIAEFDRAIKESKWKVCEKSGLRFRAEGSERTHPEIASYSQHSDWDYRYAALRVIERGKREGWDSIEKFKAEIKAELNPDAPEEGDATPTLWVSHDCYEKSDEVKVSGYCAQILGPCDRYGYNRRFLKPVAKQGKRTVGYLLTQDGVYDSKSYSRAGNCDHRWWHVVNGVTTEINREQAEAIAGPPALTETQKLAIARQQEQDERLARRATATEVVEGDFPYNTDALLFDRNGQIWIVVDAIDEYWWEDEDGVRGTGRYFGDGAIVSEWFKRIKTWIRPATAEEIAAHQAKIDRDNQHESNWQRLIEIYRMADDTATAIVPSEKMPWPRGHQIEIPVSPGTNYLAATESQVWAILYNGRDGDDWSLSNVGDGIGSYLEDPGLAQEAIALIKAIKEYKEED